MINLDRELAESFDGLLRSINRWMKFIHRQYLCQSESQDITQNQYRVLCVLKSGGPYKMSELSEIVHTSYGSLTVMIDRLVDKGLVERCFLPEDRRVVMVKITSGGAQSLGEYRKGFLDLIEKNMERLNSDQKRRLKRAINEMKSIVEDNCHF